jgi:uncharacterized cupin superfamily protein
VNALLSSGLLAASMLVSQTGDPAKNPPAPLPPAIQQTQSGPQIMQGPQIVQGQPAQQSTRPIFGWFNREDRPIITKIQSWWKRDQKDIPTSNTKVMRETPPPPISTTPTTPISPAVPNEFPRKMPNPQSQNGKPTTLLIKESAPVKTDVQQTTLQNGAHASAKSPILSVNTGRIGRDEKFEWITGQLEVENGSFVLYYATPETVDKYNGRVVLTQQKNELAQFKKGDLISVRGDLSQRQTVQGAVAMYRVNHAALIERAK